MPDLTVTVLTGGAPAKRQVTAWTAAWELFRDQPDVVAARVDGELRDLSYALGDDGAVVEPVAIDSADGRDILRHSTAHVLAQAVQDLFPDARLGIGPPIEDGFYYDFDVAEPFGPEDVTRLETRMRQIVKANQRFSRRVVTDDEAHTLLAGRPLRPASVVEVSTDDPDPRVSLPSIRLRVISCSDLGLMPWVGATAEDSDADQLRRPPPAPLLHDPLG